MVVKLVVTGAAGRMGTAIVNLAQQDKDFQVIAGLEAIAKQNVSAGLTGDVSSIQKADVVINFATPEGTAVGYFSAMKEYKTPWVIGTTGFNEKQDASIKEFSKKIPIVKSSNMSLGVNVFFKVAQQVAKALPNYVVRIQEAHHIHKLDNPSGTAKQVGKLIEDATGRRVTIEQGERKGEIAGDHKVIFTGPNDSIELFHHAMSRNIFAAGALVAAKWVVKQKPGLYSMQDVLGLNVD